MNARWTHATLFILLLGGAGHVLALESDRQQPIEVSAEDTDGSLGDGTTVLSGQVEIRQGSLYIQANRAEVEKSDGKVRVIRFLGQPATLEQEIEEQGLVQAEAGAITYQVGARIIELAGAADVTHPQYQISGEMLTYDLDRQHFEGTGSTDSPDDTDRRIRIRLEPEVAADLQGPAPEEPVVDADPGEGGEGTERDASEAPKDDSDDDSGDDVGDDSGDDSN